eukprot:2726973-Rhodomonas_salina.1
MSSFSPRISPFSQPSAAVDSKFPAVPCNPILTPAGVSGSRAKPLHSAMGRRPKRRDSASRSPVD